MSEDFPARRESHHDVFISYAQQDKPIADAVCAKLESRNIRCWIAPRDVPPGKDFMEAIIDAIEEGRAVVVIFSTHANNSPHVLRELTNAVNKDRIIIPFRIEDVVPTKSMEYLISVPHWLDAVTPPMEKHIDLLIQTIEYIIGSDKSPVISRAQAGPAEVRPPVIEPPPELPPQVPKMPKTVENLADRKQRPAVSPARSSLTFIVAGIILIALIAIFFALNGMGGTINLNPAGPIDYRGSDTRLDTVVLTVVPTQTLAKDTELFVEVEKDPSNAMITIRFAGGPGTGRVKTNRVILTRSDGSVTEGILNFNERLSEVQFQGTRGTDRIQVIVTMFSGDTKSIVDTLLPNRQYL